MEGGWKVLLSMDSYTLYPNSLGIYSLLFIFPSLTDEEGLLREGLAWIGGTYIPFFSKWFDIQEPALVHYKKSLSDLPKVKSALSMPQYFWGYQ